MSNRQTIRFQAVSDLHLEFDLAGNLYELPIHPDADFILMAGDITAGLEKRQLEWVKSVADVKPIYITLGNHEIYGSRRDKVIWTYREFFRNSNVTFLLNDSVVINGFRLIGSDLWTNFNLLGPGTASLASHAAQDKMNDFRRITYHDPIRNQYRKLRPSDTVKWHEEACDYIKLMLNDFDEPAILMTHHGISPKCKHRGYPENDLLAAAYASDLEPMFETCKQAPIFCVYGHNHDNKIDRLSCGTVIYSNQRGYNGFEDLDNFKADRLITITPDCQVVIERFND